MLNSVILIGRLTKDPELRYTPSGKAVATIRLAVDRGTVNQQGEREADFIDVITWEKQAEVIANYLQKGRLVAVQGRLQIRQYTTSDGKRREKAEVVATTVRFLDYSRDHGSSAEGAEPEEMSMGTEIYIDEEDAPF